MKDSALYLEVDEDITSAIDKLSKTTDHSVQIVVPKRSTMLQSIINLKLLKKAAENSGKELVLVTNDRIATDLAARVGLAVAPSIGAKPVIKEAEVPEALKNNEEIIEADDPEPPHPPEADPKPPKAKPPLLKRMKISDGPPAPAAGSSGLPALPDVPETPEPSAAGAAGSKLGGIKPPKVPNFGKLQKRVMWVGAAALLVGGYLLAMFLLTSAKVTLYAQGTRVSIDTTFTADTAIQESDQSKSVLAAQAVTVSKDLSGPFVPSGKKDVGTKASGTIQVSNEYDTSPHQLMAGTRFQAPDGKIFRSKEDATVPGATIGLNGGQIVLTPGKSGNIPVEADAAGDSYNEAPARYTIPGYSGAMQTKIYGQGGQMTGGTSKTITVTSQSDVDTKKAELLDKDKDNATRDLEGKVPSGYMAITASQTTSVASLNPSPAVGSEGETGTLSMKVTYSVLAVKKSEYTALIEELEQKQVGDANQIYDNGLDNAQVSASEKEGASRAAFHLTTEAYGGTKLDKSEIAKKIKGERYGDAMRTVTGLPGVTRADINIFPGWVSKLPSRPDKITITIQVAEAK